MHALLFIQYKVVIIVVWQKAVWFLHISGDRFFTPTATTKAKFCRLAKFEWIQILRWGTVEKVPKGSG